MMQGGLERVSKEDGLSQGVIAQILGYRSSVALSHMSTGRAPIPIERCIEYARVLKLDRAEFLLAVLEQRFPDIDFKRLLVGNKAALENDMAANEALIADLEAISGLPLHQLPSDRLALLKVVAAEPNAQRRFVSIHEAVLLEELRRAAPALSTRGLSAAERKELVDVISRSS